MMWQFSVTSEYPGDNAVIGNYGAEELNSAGKNLMYGMQTADYKAQKNAVKMKI